MWSFVGQICFSLAVCNVEYAKQKTYSNESNPVLRSGCFVLSSKSQDPTTRNWYRLGACVCVRAHRQRQLKNKVPRNIFTFEWLAEEKSKCENASNRNETRENLNESF